MIIIIIKIISIIRWNYFFFLSFLYVLQLFVKYPTIYIRKVYKLRRVKKVYLFILSYCCIRTGRHFQKQENSIQSHTPYLTYFYIQRQKGKCHSSCSRQFLLAVKGRPANWTDSKAINSKSAFLKIAVTLHDLNPRSLSRNNNK